jgi:large subunit ribosomal protein L17
MYRNLVTSLLEHERIETTDAKAKGVRRLADRMITLGKRGTLHARRRALRVVRKREVAAKIFDDLADRYRNRPGGYTRVLKVRRRVGDAAPLSIVELVEGEAPKVVEAPARRRGRKKASEEKGAGRGARKKTANKTATKKAASRSSAGGGKAEKSSKGSSRKKSGARKTSS